MKRTLHKLLNPTKRLTITALLLCSSWQIKANGYDNFQTNTHVKVVKCYPNPATSFINFEFQKDGRASYILQIYSFSGKRIVEMPASETKLTVTLNEFYRGIYVFQLRDNTGRIIETGKFQVVK